jgi:hypothetical protein
MNNLTPPLVSEPEIPPAKDPDPEEPRLTDLEHPEPPPGTDIVPPAPAGVPQRREGVVSDPDVELPPANR